MQYFKAFVVVAVVKFCGHIEGTENFEFVMNETVAVRLIDLIKLKIRVYSRCCMQCGNVNTKLTDQEFLFFVISLQC